MPLLSQPFIFAGVLTILGAVAGLIAGLFGVGGGIVVIPTLVVLFKVSGIAPDPAIHAAVGISMMTIVATSFASLRAHARHDAIEHSIVRDWAPVVVAGSVIGSLAATRLSGASLSLIFGAFITIMAFFMGIVPANMATLKVPPGGVLKRIMAFVIGFLSALIGIGGGSLSVPTLVLCRTPIHRAIGTASVIGLLISLPAALVFLALQFARAAPLVSTGSHAMAGHLLSLDLMAFAVLVPTTMLMAPVGARLAHSLPAVNLRRIFALLLVIIAVKMFMTGLSG